MQAPRARAGSARARVGPARCRAGGACGPVVGHAGPADPLSGTRGRRTRCRARGAGGPVVGHAGPTTGGPQRRQGAVMARNVFILGLDQHNLEILWRLPGAGELAFHRLLSVEELQGEHIDVPVLLDRAVQQLEAFDGPIDAIVSFWGFPMVVMVPILCARYGLPSANLLAVLRCEHKLRSEEHTSELQSRGHLVCRLLLEI